ncbi:hypothetical protein SBOR_7092 [Sclerotinia borealis F-4128]|uniref:Uncharacterized protein n=1 Tax=Sclerotinia borealis (strain F-4128) TaxID=1432307 RepID=W9CD85_SCLBF|nr:hypothetical protein SBOR_7092 [Sclerotinia borealis F-4128]
MAPSYDGPLTIESLTELFKSYGFLNVQVSDGRDKEHKRRVLRGFGTLPVAEDEQYMRADDDAEKTAEKQDNTAKTSEGMNSTSADDREKQQSAGMGYAAGMSKSQKRRMREAKKKAEKEAKATATNTVLGETTATTQSK